MSATADDLRRAEARDDLAKLYGTSPYDTPGNPCYGDGHFARSLLRKYSFPNLEALARWAKQAPTKAPAERAPQAAPEAVVYTPRTEAELADVVAGLAGEGFRIVAVLRAVGDGFVVAAQRDRTSRTETLMYHLGEIVGCAAEAEDMPGRSLNRRLLEAIARAAAAMEAKP